MGRSSRGKQMKANAINSMSPHATVSGRPPQRYQRTAPCCGQVICPKLKDYYIKQNTYHQYRCESCGSWLTFESDTKLEAGALSFLYLMTVGFLILTGASRLSRDQMECFVFLLIALAIVLGSWYLLLAIYLRRCATWIVEKR
jgi:hypothetical protein